MLLPGHTEVMLLERVKASIRDRWNKRKQRTPFLRNGNSMTMWQRQTMNEDVLATVNALDPSTRRAIEVSGHWWRDHGWAEFTGTDFRAFDLVNPPDDFEGWGTYDVVLCEQVLDHVPGPITGMRIPTELARIGGTVIVSTPFLLKIHAAPLDFWRFTPEGLRILMESSGLENVQVKSWGNRWCVASNFRRWTPARWWRSSRNEPEFPIQVWGTGVRATPASGH